jgi:hypothetical protein
MLYCVILMPIHTCNSHSSCAAAEGTRNGYHVLSLLLVTLAAVFESTFSTLSNSQS